MKALITKDGRIVQLALEPFEVHKDLSWKDVADDTTTQDTYAHGAVVKFVQPVIPQKPAVLTLDSLAAALVTNGILTTNQIEVAKSAEAADVAAVLSGDVDLVESKKVKASLQAKGRT